ncbi:MAG: hypothetical protein MUF42_03235 [Cytophagaceae bacterium]|jgi:hypothetical protein|nr:hypothetical protein [Cytophagaceae bacterium]
MKKYLLAAIFILLAPLLGGLYGALFDQFTFFISPDFFIKVRGVSEQSPSLRWEVAQSGFSNTWTIGLILGTVLGLVGLFHDGLSKQWKVTLQSFLISLFLATVFAVLGFWIPLQASGLRYPDIGDQEAFRKVVQMNNFAKIGGVIGMLAGIGWHVWKFRSERKKRNTLPKSV